MKTVGYFRVQDADDIRRKIPASWTRFDYELESDAFIVAVDWIISNGLIDKVHIPQETGLTAALGMLPVEVAWTLFRSGLFRTQEAGMATFNENFRATYRGDIHFASADDAVLFRMKFL